MLLEYAPLQPYAERYRDLSGQALHITLHLKLGGRLAGYDPIHLDNLLAYCVVQEATQGQGLPESPLPYLLPVPLRCLWRSEEGYPLWAAAQLRPVGPAVTDVSYWHKRVQSGRFSASKTGTFAIRSTNGRWMERRVPLPTQACMTWLAEAIGDPAEIGRLLAPLAFVGKKRGIGFGEIDHWTIEPVAHFNLVAEKRLIRSIPAGAVALLGNCVPAAGPAPVGWTPPEWKPMLFRPGWWAGTPVQEVTAQRTVR